MRGTQRIIDGGVQRKVDCQSCGQAKIEGEVCEAELSRDKGPAGVEVTICGWPQIELEQVEDGRLRISLPLCPSTNDRQEPIRVGRYAQMRNTDKANDYIASVSAQLRPLINRAMQEWGWKPVTYWRGIDLWVILPRASADCHNYGKVLFDALEAGGVTFNDKYLIPNYRGIWHDTKTPVVVVLV